MFGDLGTTALDKQKITFLESKEVIFPVLPTTFSCFGGTQRYHMLSTEINNQTGAVARMAEIRVGSCQAGHGDCDVMLS